MYEEESEDTVYIHMYESRKPFNVRTREDTISRGRGVN